MKKSLVITLFLVLSSFFFISIKEVKAEDITFTCPEERISLLNEEFYSYRDKVINYANENNYYYYIYYWLYEKKYQVIFFHSDSDSFLANSRYEFHSYDYNISDVKLLSLSDTTNFSDIINLESFGFGFSDFTLLDYSFNVFTTYEVNLVCNGKTFVFNQNNKFPSLYDFTSSEPVIDSHLGEKQIIANFYTICIEKIKYLGDKIVSNYIYLSIIVVLILVFIIELIRRWLM